MLKKNLPFFTAITLLVFFFFSKAFSVKFFLDDFSFLKISKISSFSQFLNFFNPNKAYFYRPIPTEVFYFFIRNNIFFGHLTVFLTYLIGLYFLFKIVQIIFKKRALTMLTIFLYSISFSHVFQLYWFATYQEVMVFTGLIISFYFYLNSKYFLSLLFFVLALLSKETAILFPVFLLLFTIFSSFWQPRVLGGVQNLDPGQARMTILYFLLALIFFFLYRYGVSAVTTSELTYRLQLNPKLIFNNFMWYSFWSLGIPNFFPDHMKSIFFVPLPSFWSFFRDFNFKAYLIFYIPYVLLFFTSILILTKKIWKNKQLIALFCFLILSYLLFISPTLPTIHKWMVRLTLPLIFMVLIQANLIYLLLTSGKKTKILGIVLLILYFFWNLFGVKLHESTSTYFLENRIVNNAQKYFKKNRKEIEKTKFIYFSDPKTDLNAWGESRKLENTFHGQNFLDYYFPGKNLTAIWGYKQKNIPENAYMINSVDLLN